MGRPTSCSSPAHSSGQGDGRPPFMTDDLSSSWDVRHPLAAHSSGLAHGLAVRVLVHYCGCSKFCCIIPSNIFFKSG